MATKSQDYLNTLVTWMLITILKEEHKLIEHYAHSQYKYIFLTILMSNLPTIEFWFQWFQLIRFLLMPKLSLVSAENVHSTLNEAPAQTRAINVKIELKQGDHKWLMRLKFDWTSCYCCCCCRMIQQQAQSLVCSTTNGSRQQVSIIQRPLLIAR